MVEATLGALLMSLTGRLQRRVSSLRPASSRAIHLPAIATATQEEHLSALGAPANDEPQRVQAFGCQWRQKLDTHRSSCDDTSVWEGVITFGSLLACPASALSFIRGMAIAPKAQGPVSALARRVGHGSRFPHLQTTTDTLGARLSLRLSRHSHLAPPAGGSAPRSVQSERQERDENVRIFAYVPLLGDFRHSAF